MRLRHRFFSLRLGSPACARLAACPVLGRCCSRPLGTRSLADGSGLASAMPEVTRCGYSAVQLKDHRPPVRALYGALPGIQTVGRAERYSVYKLLEHALRRIEHVVVDLSSLASDVAGAVVGVGEGKHARIWRNIW